MSSLSIQCIDRVEVCGRYPSNNNGISNEDSYSSLHLPTCNGVLSVLLLTLGPTIGYIHIATTSLDHSMCTRKSIL